MVALVVFYGVPAAFADGKAPVNSMLSLFNGKDSHGIELAQFQLSIDMGGVTALGQMPVAQLLQFTWSCYAWWVGMVGWVADWTVQMDWVPYVAGPLADASQRLHDDILGPLGLTSTTGRGVMALLMAVGAGVGAWRIQNVGAGSGILSWLSSGAAAALAVSVFAVPVATVLGTSTGLAKPLVYARGISIQVAASIQGKDVMFGPDDGDTLTPGQPLPKADTNDHVLQQVPESLKVSTMLIDTLVRPAHQALNYGADIDSAKCSNGKQASDVYDEALKKGPYWDMGDDTSRKALGGCQGDYKKYAENPSWSALAAAALYTVAGWILGAVVLWFVYVMCRCVIMLAWGSFKTTYQALAAIASPSSLGGLAESLMEIGASLWLLVSNLLMFSVVLMGARGVLTNGKWSLSLRFAVVDIVLVIGCGLLTVNYLQTLRGAKRLSERFANKLGLDRRNKINWAQTGRDAMLGYTAYNEIKERRAAQRGQRGVTGPSQASSSNPEGQQPTTRRQTMKKVAGTAVAKTGGAAGVVATVAADKVSAAAHSYGDMVDGKQVTGATKAALPAAKVHAMLRDKKNRILNAGSEAVEALDEQRIAGRDGAAHPQVSSSGSARMDRLAHRLGRGQRGIDQTAEAAGDVVAASRNPGRRGQKPVGTGSKVIDKGLQGVGASLRVADKTADIYQRPASITPATQRRTRQDLRTATPSRDASRGVAGNRPRRYPERRPQSSDDLAETGPSR